MRLSIRLISFRTTQPLHYHIPVHQRVPYMAVKVLVHCYSEVQLILCYFITIIMSSMSFVCALCVQWEIAHRTRCVCVYVYVCVCVVWCVTICHYELCCPYSRPQPKNVNSECLATIEAVYYFFKTVYEMLHDG